MWGSAAAFLLAFAEFDPENPATSPLLTATIPGGALVIGAAVYLIYLLYGHWYEAWRVHHATSELASSGSISVGQLQQRVEVAAKEVEDVLIGLNCGLPKAEDRRLIDKYLPKARANLSQQVTVNHQLLTNNNVAAQAHGVRDEPSIEHIQKTIEDQLRRSEKAENDFAKVIEYLKNSPSATRLAKIESDLVAGHNAARSLQSSFDRRTDELIAVSNSLHGRARRHFIGFTLTLPFLFGFVALISLTVLQWNTAISFVTGVLTGEETVYIDQPSPEQLENDSINSLSFLTQHFGRSHC